MTRTLSFFLSLLRVVAAFAVFLDHVSNLVRPIGYIGRHGVSAVVAFFVLSGFVISWTADTKEDNAATYIKSRVARIMPVVLIALFVTWLSDLIGWRFAPQNYLGASYYSGDYFGALWKNLLFLNQVWFSHSIFGSNEPYWSLGFEVPYYVMFGIAMFAEKRIRVVLLTVYALVLGPVILAYMSIWLLGVATYRICKSGSLVSAPANGVILLTACTVVYLALQIWYHPLNIFATEGNFIARWAFYNFIGILVSASIIAVGWLPGDDLVNDKMQNAVDWLANGTFTLYLTHLPILILLKSVIGINDLPSKLAVVGLTVIICYGIAEVAERPKRTYRRLLDKIY